MSSSSHYPTNDFEVLICSCFVWQDCNKNNVAKIFDKNFMKRPNKITANVEALPMWRNLKNVSHNQ